MRVPNSSVAVACHHVYMGYGREVVLRDVTLMVPEGAFLPLVGPNGAGKTTLLRGVLGLLKPISGSIDIPRRSARLGYVPQHQSIDPLFPLTVEQIVAMGLYPQLGWWRRAGKEHKLTIRWALSEVGLDGHSHKNFRQLSGGMKQKALIARALVTGADILVMDEPTSELDARSEQEVIGHLHRLSCEQGKTVLIACHGLQHAVALADRVCIVDHGNAQIAAASEAREFAAANREG